MESNGNGNGFLIAAAIFEAPLKTESVEAFGRKLLVQELMEDQSSAVVEGEADNNTRGRRLLILCVLDPDTRKPIFQESDLPRLGKLSRTELIKITRAVNRVNGWAPAEDIAKNSEASQTVDSATV